MLKARLLTSIVAVPLLLVLLWVDGTIGRDSGLFPILVAAIAGVASTELVAMLSRLVPGVQRVDVLVSNLLIVGGALGTAAFDGESGPETIARGALVGMAIAAGCALLMAVVDAVRYERGRYENGNAVLTYAAKLFALAYVGGGLSLAGLLRYLSPNGADVFLPLAVLIITVKMSDIGAYFVGRIVGGPHPLGRLSPGKTVSGFVGGLVVGSTAGTVLTVRALSYGKTPALDPADPNATVMLLAIAGICFAISAAGIIGDLMESLLKRSCGVKDSGTILPGFGGVLDLVDSILFAGAIPSVIALFVVIFD